jgi:hypothetical protein
VSEIVVGSHLGSHPVDFQIVTQLIDDRVPSKLYTHEELAVQQAFGGLLIESIDTTLRRRPNPRFEPIPMRTSLRLINR